MSDTDGRLPGDFWMTSHMDKRSKPVKIEELRALLDAPPLRDGSLYYRVVDALPSEDD